MDVVSLWFAASFSFTPKYAELPANLARRAWACVRAYTGGYGRVRRIWAFYA